MKKTIIYLIILITFIIGSCMPYINTDLDVRQHIKTDRYWLGYTGEELISNKLLDITTVEEVGTTDTDGHPTYTIYLATQKGMQTSTDEGDTWSSLKYNDSEILGVADIYDDKGHSMIFISSESGLYYKNYTDATISKVESSGTFALKKVDLTNSDFRVTGDHRTSEDIDGYSVLVYKNIVFIATTTGLYFSTDFYGAPNSAHWGNIIGKNIVTMRQKDIDYPQTTLEAAEMDYDPIYDPVLDLTFNPSPDFYAGNGVTINITVAGKNEGDPITEAEFTTAGGDMSNALHMDDQRAMRLIYETVNEIEDYGNPNNEEDGVMRKYAYYRDMRLKATRIKDISIYDDVIYLATEGGGVSSADMSIFIASLDSDDIATYDDEFIWETYMHNYFHYPTIKSDISSRRGSENSWSIGSEMGICIEVDDKGVFYGSEGAGIGLASTYKSIIEVLDVDGIRYDKDGNREYKLKSNAFELYNYSYFPSVAGDTTGMNKDEIANFYFRADKDAYDGIGNENLVQGLRFNWKEFTDRGYSVYTAPGDIAPYQSPVRKFPDNTIRKIRFGNLGLKQLIYIATNNGMGVAEVKKSFSFSDNTKIPASIVGDTQYTVGFVDWGEYHKDPTQLAEQIFVTDLAITKDKDGNDKYIYAATAGQGLVRFRWEEYEQDPFNLDLETLKE